MEHLSFVVKRLKCDLLSLYSMAKRDP